MDDGRSGVNGMSFNKYKPTHRELCDRAAYWLQTSLGCKLVLVERNSGRGGEEPDAIGWTPCGHSSLIEVKVSRQDFLADKKKPHRKIPEKGMGRRRYLLCQRDLIKPEEAPEGWILLWATEHQIRHKTDIGDSKNFEIDQQKEMQMLIHSYRMVRLGVMIVPIATGEKHP